MVISMIRLLQHKGATNMAREKHVMRVVMISIAYHPIANKIIGLGADNRLYWAAVGLRKTEWRLVTKGQLPK